LRSIFNVRFIFRLIEWVRTQYRPTRVRNR